MKSRIAFPARDPEHRIGDYRFGLRKGAGPLKGSRERVEREQERARKSTASREHNKISRDAADESLK